MFGKDSISPIRFLWYYWQTDIWNNERTES